MNKIVALSILGLLAGLALAQPPAPGSASTQPTTRPALTPGQEKAARELIEQLGSNDYTVRETATKKLVEMGEAVHPLLQARRAEKNLDPEIASRIDTILHTPSREQPGTTVTDPASGVTVSITADGSVEGRIGDRLIWKVALPKPGAASLHLVVGRGVLVYPNRWLLDPATGKVIPTRG